MELYFDFFLLFKFYFLELGFCKSWELIALFFFVFGGMMVGRSLLFSYLLVFYILGSMVNFRWGGYFIFFDCYVYVITVFMMLFILGLIVMCEGNNIVVFLSEVLVYLCFFFFFSLNIFVLYVFFELSVLPILIMILGFGSQVEKINSAYYLVFYTVLCSSPFLYVFFSSNFLLFFAYYDIFLS